MQRLTFNSVHLGGNLVNDPEFSEVNGINTVSFVIAIEDGAKNAPHTSKTTCRASGEVASTIGKWFAQGDRILVTGTLRSVAPFRERTGTTRALSQQSSHDRKSGINSVDSHS